MAIVIKEFLLKMESVEDQEAFQKVRAELLKKLEAEEQSPELIIEEAIRRVMELLEERLDR